MPSETARHPAILRADNTQIVVVDMQEPFLRTIWERERVVRNVALLLDAARVLNLSVVTTEQNRERMGGTIPEIMEKLTALDTATAPLDKMCFSCCGSETFAEALRRTNRTQILVCGIETHICVCQTVLDLLGQGYQVHVTADAVSSRASSNVEIGLKKVERAGAHLTSVEMAVYEMLVEAGTPAFRQILTLMR